MADDITPERLTELYCGCNFIDVKVAMNALLETSVICMPLGQPPHVYAWDYFLVYYSPITDRVMRIILVPRATKIILPLIKNKSNVTFDELVSAQNMMSDNSGDFHPRISFHTRYNYV
jgi:hypothetical protein